MVYKMCSKQHIILVHTEQFFFFFLEILCELWVAMCNQCKQKMLFFANFQCCFPLHKVKRYTHSYFGYSAKSCVKGNFPCLLFNKIWPAAMFSSSSIFFVFAVLFFYFFLCMLSFYFRGIFPFLFHSFNRYFSSDY